MSFRVANQAAGATPSTLTDLTVTNNLTLSGGTVNGVLYLNASKVATSGSALQFNGSQLFIGGSSSVGASATPRFTALASDGVFLIGAQGGINGAIRAGIIHTITANIGGLAFATGGDNNVDATEKMRLDASGNLGIGTTPGAKLDVAGTSAKLTNNTSADVTVQIGPDVPNATRSGRIGFITSSVQKNWYIANNWNTVGGLEFTQTTIAGGSTMGGTPAMTLDAYGNLIQSAPTTPPTLSTNGTMVFNLTSNTNLRVSVRGSDGVTRTANLTLA